MSSTASAMEAKPWVGRSRSNSSSSIGKVLLVREAALRMVCLKEADDLDWSDPKKSLVALEFEAKSET